MKMNNELIKVTVKNDQQLVSARDLYKGLEIRTRFSLWVSQNFKEFEKGSDFQPVVITTPRENRGSIELQDCMQGYHLINVTDNSIFTDEYDNLADLQTNIRNLWHKVNAKLVIE